MSKIEFFTQFQIGFMFTITKWYKGERNIILSIPFLDIWFHQIHKKYK